MAEKSSECLPVQPSMNWPFKWFSYNEFECNCGCGTNSMDIEFIRLLEDLRNNYGKPIIVTSGYRCPVYDASPGIRGKGAHTTGHATDIVIPRRDFHEFLLEHVGRINEFTGVGVKQKTAGSFIHLDNLSHGIWRTKRPALWTY
jgi:zinc D-Ala-D-Ala carboxypeptidase